MNTTLLDIINDTPVKVHSIVIPSDTPFFLTIIAIHVLAAMVCVISGATAMLAKKQPKLHPLAGKVYFYGLSVVFLTVIIISYLRWREDYPLLILGTLAFGLAFTGKRAKRYEWQNWPAIHVWCMGLSYIVMLTAFYVDNGKFLPVWKDLPIITYWTIPSIIGIPIIIITLRRHPVVKNYNKTLTK